MQTTDWAKQVVGELFAAYLSRSQEMPEGHAKRDNLPRAVADYIAGMTDRYLQVVQDKTRPDTLAAFIRVATQLLQEGATDAARLHALIADQLFDKDVFDRLARNITFMWYSGQWLPALRDAGVGLAQQRNISADAYVQGLMWKTAFAHPPGAQQPGYGSWARPPIGIS
jgi:hypothetical protein